MADSILQHQLEKLAADRYPLHMPGHKRHLAPAPGLSCYAWDITEIDGADDLHEADGILADAMARTAALYGARRCWYLVGGSTVGLLAGIRALAPFGSEVIAARNCHKAVYHAIELGCLTAHYLHGNRRRRRPVGHGRVGCLHDEIRRKPVFGRIFGQACICLLPEYHRVSGAGRCRWIQRLYAALCQRAFRRKSRRRLFVKFTEYNLTNPL